MVYLLHFIYGFVTAYLSLLSPGMINMTAVRIRIDNGKKQSVLFSFGAAIIVLVQASIALVFANYLTKNPEIIESLKAFGVVVFFALAIFFFYQARKKHKYKGKKQKGNYFIIGLFMTSLNMLGIPFYLGVGTFLSAEGYLILKQPNISYFVIGVSLGAFALFLTYVFLANIIVKRVGFIARNINYVLSILFVILGFLTLYKLLA